MKKFIYAFGLFITGSFFGIVDIHAQIQGVGDTIICYANDFETDAYVLPPEHFEQGAGAKLSNFKIDFGADVPSQARPAIRFAADIWSSTLASSVPIRVDVRWDSLGQDALASAGPTTLFRDFPGASGPTIWYPVALAEAITGQELNDTTEADIAININKATNWYFGLDGNTPFNQIDLATVILHELAHGLGFLSSAIKTKDEEGQFGFEGLLFIFDGFIRNDLDQFLSDTTLFHDPSVELLQEFTSGRLFFASLLAASFNGDMDPQLFAPAEFDEGSSLSHLDESIFRDKQDDALMTPRLARSEAIHHPGNVTIAIMEQIGWNSVLTAVVSPRIVEQPLRTFPNPTTGPLHIAVPAFRPGTIIRLAVMDMTGRRVLLLDRKAMAEGASLELDLGSLPSGAYLVTLAGNEELFRTRVLRE
jgi:hypothetical protein